MAAKPVVLPDSFNDEGSWTECKYHFENVAKVNGWDNAKKLQWLRVRLMRCAQRAEASLPTPSRHLMRGSSQRADRPTTRPSSKHVGRRKWRAGWSLPTIWER